MQDRSGNKLQTRRMIIQSGGMFHMYVNAEPIGTAPTRDQAERQLSHFIYWLWQGVEEYRLRQLNAGLKIYTAG